MKSKKHEIRPVERRPGLYHNCTRGRCKHKGTHVVLIGGVEVQVCRPHASAYCKRHGLKMPAEQPEDQVERTDP